MAELGLISAALSDFLGDISSEIGMDWNFTHIDTVLAPIVVLGA
jgi:hypothetical protein